MSPFRRFLALLTLMISVFVDASALEVIQPSLRLDFSQGDIQARDALDQPVTARVSGTPQWKDGRQGKALLTGNDGAYLYFPSSLLAKDSGTIEMWLSPQDWDGSDQTFHLFFQVSGKGSLLFYKYHTRDLGLLFLSDNQSEGHARVSSAPFHDWKPGEWYHLAATWSPHRQEVFLNGKLVAAGLPKLPTALDPEFLIGDHPFNVSIPRKANSLIEDVRLYSIPLSAEAIQARYEGKPVPLTPLSKDTAHVDYTLQNQKIVPTLTLNGATLPIEHARVQIQLFQDDRLLATQENVPFDGITARGEFSSELKPGTYRIHFHVRHPQGDSLGELDYDLVVPDRSWMGNSLGKEDIVPAPWTPLTHEVSGNDHRFHCWGRTYHFANSLLPTQITAKDQPLLSRAMSLELVHGDNVSQRQDWELGPIELKEQSDTRARFERRGWWKIGQTKHEINAEYHLEYDGLLWVSLHLAQPEALPEGTVRLTLSMPSERALYHHGWDESLKPFSKALEAHEGTLHASAFLPSYWLGDNDRGLFWFCESAESWPAWQDAHAIELRREGEQVHLHFNLSRSPQRKEGSWQFQFGLQATPVKALPTKWRQWSFPPMPKATAEIIWPTTEVDSMKYFGYAEARNEEAFNQRIARLHKQGRKVIPYSALNAISGHSPEWKWFGPSWDVKDGDYGSGDVVAVGAQFHFTSPTQESWQDFIVWKNHQFFVKHHLDGVYHDLTYPWGWAVESANTGWKDGDVWRKTHPTRAFRELYRRHYKSIKAVNPDALLIGHMSSWMNIPVLAYEDAILNGETLRVPLQGKTSYHDVLPLDQWRIEYTGRQWGVIPILLPEFDQDAYHQIEPTRELAGLTLLHDVLVWPIWSHSGAWAERHQRLEHFDLLHAEFIPYWSDEPPVLSAPEGVKVSLYQAPDGTILGIACNLMKTEASGSLKLNPEHFKSERLYQVREPQFKPGNDPLTLEIQIPASSYEIFTLIPDVISK